MKSIDSNTSKKFRLVILVAMLIINVIEESFFHLEKG